MGHDSFLDIVANIVGILVILVMVTGVRAKNWGKSPEPPKAIAVTEVALEKDQATEGALRGEVRSLLARQQRLAVEAAMQSQVRMQLATATAAVEAEIQSRRGRLDAESQEELHLRQELADARTQRDRLHRELQTASQTGAAPRQIESYPTPLSKPVDGRELHFYLKQGRIALVPLDRLVEAVRDDARRKMRQLRDVPELTDTVGPEGGFRLRYTIVRRRMSEELHVATGAGGDYIEMERWTLVPEPGELGEPVDAALAGGSRFRQVLASVPPATTTVTIWTYDDSFPEYRRIKKALYQLGFATAGRPLPDGVPIGGSPQGTKSAAQ